MPTGQQYASTAPQTNLVGGINNTQQTGTVVSFTGFPATPFTATLDIGTPTQEIVDIITVSGTSITQMNRGVDGSSAQAHSNNATVTHTVIGRDFREARAHIDASASNDSQGHPVHGLTAGSAVVGTTDVQTLTNKTLTSPTITGMSSANPSITGTVTGGAQYQNITAGTAAVGSIPLIAKGLANQTADLFDVQTSGGTPVFAVTANGATGAGRVLVTPTDTANSSLIVNSPSGLTASILKLQLNAVDQVTVDNTGQLNMLVSPLRVAGITGAASSSRYVGATAGGPPTTGTFQTGDWVVDKTYGINWTCTAGGTPGTWVGDGQAKIATTTLGGTATTITFSSIPSYFKHLTLKVAAVASTATVQNALQMTFNGDSGAHYDQVLSYQATSLTRTETHTPNNTFITAGFAWGNSNTNVPGMSNIDIVNYSSSTLIKTCEGRFHSSDTGVANWNAGNFQGAWNSVAAITSITLSLSGAVSFAAGTTVDLYATA